MGHDKGMKQREETSDQKDKMVARSDHQSRKEDHIFILILNFFVKFCTYPKTDLKYLRKI